MKELRGVVAGASGIGRHHLKALLGEEVLVTGILGSTPQSADARVKQLSLEHGGNPFFKAKPYNLMHEMLEREKPDLVTIATPDHTHDYHLTTAIAYNANSLVEKPPVWNPSLSPEDNVKLFKKISNLAREKGLILAVNTQYPATLKHYQAIHPFKLEEVEEFYMRMTPAAKGLGMIIDVMMHPNSILLHLFPEGVIKEGSLSVEGGEEAIDLRFQYSTNFKEVRVHYRFEHRDKAEIMSRGADVEYGFNNKVVERVVKSWDEMLFKDKHGEKQVRARNPLHESLAAFVKAVRTGNERELLVSNEEAAKNLEMLAAAVKCYNDAFAGS